MWSLPDSESEPDAEPAPRMPRVRGVKPKKHREKIPKVAFPFSACVARPVSRNEIAAQPAAKKAMDEEYDKLRYKVHPSLSKPGCWDEDLVRPRADVMREARKAGKEVHFGDIFGICVEKGSELEEHLRKYKGRFVFRGNEVKDQNWEVAMFQELGSSPAAMESSKAADFYGLLPGHALP